MNIVKNRTTLSTDQIENPALENGNHSLSENGTFREQFEALEIPPNIDPRLLALWLQREQAAIEGKTKSQSQSTQNRGRQLNRMFAAYVGIVVMCLVIVLGLIKGQEPNVILQSCCQAFLIYAIIGFVVGSILESCITDSVETLLREIVRRTNEAAALAQSDAAQTASSETSSDLSTDPDIRPA